MDCILNPNLENCKSLETPKFGLVNENHLDAISPHTENKIPPDDQKGKEKEVDDSLRSPLSLEPKTVLPISNIRSPPTEPVLSGPLLSGVITEFPVAPLTTICTPGSGSCGDCQPGDSSSPPDARCQQEVPASKPIAPDCPCLESAVGSGGSGGSGDCQEGSTCEEARPAPTEGASPRCPAGECVADEGNKGKSELNITESCHSSTCPPGPVSLSHDEEDDERNSSSESVIATGPADCSAGSDDPDCIPGRPDCEAGSTDPACGRRVEKGKVEMVPAWARRYL